MTRRALRKIIEKLESPDAFERLDAELSLRHLTQRDFGFRWDATDAQRSEALDRIRNWIEREREAAVKPSIDGPPTLDIDALKKMSPDEMQKHLQALLAKAKFVAGFPLTRHRCEECHSRPATVEVLECESRAAVAISMLCEPCAEARGEIRKPA